MNSTTSQVIKFKFEISLSWYVQIDLEELLMKERIGNRGK
ncbi:unnamed protein product [Paramecium sonneborni]|uniref:Uncharacterized protein n=1 Tax=Paramecium sonneborni TaxID=65129 RepID=A0A8S1MHS8_9CILI|nr:unnamed protein product [Paramecium sonneborni]